MKKLCFTKKPRNTGDFLPVQLGSDPEMIDEHEEHIYNISIVELMYCISRNNNTYPMDSFYIKKN